MNSGVRTKLSVMMFLQYFVWGAWFVTLNTYLGTGLGFEGSQIGWCYAALPIAAMISPFFVGMFADRFFSTERVLLVLHLVGAGLIFVAASQTDFGSMFPFIFLYALCYMPTLPLTNSISFHQMESPEKQFPGIRVWGTIGWIVAGTLVGKLRMTPEHGFTFATLAQDGTALQSIEPTHYPMLIAAASSVVLGIYCFFLPHTPPTRTDTVTAREVLGLDALQLLKSRSFLVFVIGSFLIAIPLQFYYTFTNQFLNSVKFPEAAYRMTFGQWSEIFFMLVMPVFFVRLGVKKMLLIGMLAWVVRYFLFSMGEFWALYIGIVLHGICYDFFFVTGQIYVDSKAPKNLRASAQGLIALVTLGAGGAIGTVICGYILDRFETAPGSGQYEWSTFWLLPALFAGGVMIFFAFAFNDKFTRPAADAPLGTVEG